MSALSEQVLQISVSYLGPAARKFLERQTASHMDGLVFDDLKPGHLPQLSWWIHASAKLVIDSVKAKEFADKVAALGKTPAGHAQ
jgi:hypothetical protein